MRPVTREAAGVHGHGASRGVERPEQERADRRGRRFLIKRGGVVLRVEERVLARWAEARVERHSEGCERGVVGGIHLDPGRVGENARVLRVRNDDIQLVVDAGGDLAVLGHARRRRFSGCARAGRGRQARRVVVSGAVGRGAGRAGKAPMVTFCPLSITAPVLMVSVALEARLVTAVA